MVFRLSKYAIEQVGGFLATWVTQGFSSALSSLPFYYARTVVRREILEPRENQQRPQFDLSKILKEITRDTYVMSISNTCMDILENTAKSYGIPLNMLASGTIRTAIIGALYRQQYHREPLELNAIVTDLLNGLGRSYLIGKSIEAMMSASNNTGNPVPLPILVAAGVAGECLLHQYKQLLARNYAMIKSDIIREEERAIVLVRARN